MASTVRLLFCLSFLTVFSAAIPGSVSQVLAQDDAAGEFGDPAPAPAPAPAAEAPADNADAGGGGAAPSASQKNLLGWMVEALGIPYVLIFFLLSVTLVSLFVMNMLAARRETLCPQELVESFEEKLNEKDFQGAYDMARSDESVLGQVLSAGLAKLNRG